MDRHFTYPLGHFIKAENLKLIVRSLVLCADFVYKLILQNVDMLVVAAEELVDVGQEGKV